MSDINLLKPLAVFERLFERKVRLENRRNEEHAAFNVSVNVLESCHGSAIVKVGNTEVICGAKVKILPDAVDAGTVVCNVELNSLANRSVHPNTSVVKESQFLSSSLQRLITTVMCPNSAKDLNIYSTDNPTQPIGSYLIKLDLVVLYDDGCLLDACVSAAVSTLLSVSWPKISDQLNDNTEESISKQYKQQVPTVRQTLSVTDWPVTLSFCCIPLTIARERNIPSVICQPSRRELSLWDTDAGPGFITLSCNSGNILQLSMTNAFLPILLDNSNVRESEVKAELSNWQLLFNVASDYGSYVKIAIQDALEKASIGRFV